MSSVVAKQTGYPLPQQDLSLKSRRKPLKIPLLIVTSVLLIGILFLSYIHLLNKATSLSYKAYNAALSLDRLEEEIQEYELQALKLHSLDYIEEAAIDHLGMVTPDTALLTSLIK